MNDIKIVCVFVFLIWIVCIAIAVINTLMNYFRERKYIMMEIQRTDGEENLYWRHELKALNYFLIPFIGPAIAKKMRP